MNTKFTKGEFVCRDDDGEIWIDSVNVGLVADLCTSNAGYIESLANAHLIAAAPDMYKILAELIENMSADNSIRASEWVNDIDLILKKARGELICAE